MANNVRIQAFIDPFLYDATAKLIKDTQPPFTTMSRFVARTLDAVVSQADGDTTNLTNLLNELSNKEEKECL